MPVVCSWAFQELLPHASQLGHIQGLSGLLGIFSIALVEIYSCRLCCSKASQEKTIRQLMVPRHHKHIGIRVCGDKALPDEDQESTSNILAC